MVRIGLAHRFFQYEKNGPIFWLFSVQSIYIFLQLVFIFSIEAEQNPEYLISNSSPPPFLPAVHDDDMAIFLSGMNNK